MSAPRVYAALLQSPRGSSALGVKSSVFHPPDVCDRYSTTPRLIRPRRSAEWVTKPPNQAPSCISTTFFAPYGPESHHVGTLAAGMTLTSIVSGCFSCAAFARLTTLFGILLLFKQLQCTFGSKRELRIQRTWHLPVDSILLKPVFLCQRQRLLQFLCHPSVCHPQICGPIELRMNY